jgi:quinol monooxygenase YgiN
MYPCRRLNSLLSASLPLLLSGLLPSGASAQEQPNPLVAQVKAAVRDPDQPFALLIRMQAKEGAGPKIEAAFAKAAPLTRREKGCLAYDLHRDAKVPTRYLLYERWQNVAALAAHQNSTHLAALRKEVNDLRMGPPVVEVLQLLVCLWREAQPCYGLNQFAGRLHDIDQDETVPAMQNSPNLLSQLQKPYVSAAKCSSRLHLPSTQPLPFVVQLGHRRPVVR